MKQSVWIALGLSLGLCSAFGQSAQILPLAEYFGFGPMEIIKIDPGIGSLRVCDLNGDGRQDLAVINNRQSRIEIHLRRPAAGSDEEISAADAESLNELPGNPWYDSQPLLITVRPANLAAGDLNGDGRADLAFYGDPAGLYIVTQEPPDGKTLRWQAPHKIRIDDGLTRPGGLDLGDLNGDGRLDIVMAGQNSVYLLLQNAEGRFEDPQSLGIEGKISEVRIRDLDGDTKQDLLFLIEDRDRPIQVRFGMGDGLFGPLLQFESDPPVSLKTCRIGQNKKEQILFVEKRTGRLMGAELILQSGDENSEQVAPGVVTYPLNIDSGGESSDLVCGDVNGDGRMDLVVSQPQAARVSVYLQEESGITRPVEFPAFSKIDWMVSADVDRDGQDEIGMLSITEHVIGISRFENGRLSYPQALSLVGEPVAMELADIDADKQIECIYISRDSEDKRWLRFYEFVPGEINLSQNDLLLEKVLSNPSGIRVLDVNADGLKDILVFQMYDDPLLIVQKSDHTFRIPPAASAQSGLIKGGSRRTLIPCDINGDGLDEVLVARQNFARSVRFEDSKWQIQDQFNASGKNDEVLTAGAFDLDGDGTKEIVLLEGRKNRLQILRAGPDGTYRVDEQRELVSLDPSEHMTMKFDSFFGGGKQLLIFDGRKFVLLPCMQRQGAVAQYRINSLFTAETAVREGRYADLAAGDLNSDGQTDLVMVEYRKNNLEILTFPPDAGKPVLATRFQVFEEKNYQEQMTRSGPEPRELVVADLNGDGADDLAVVIHDRIILYPQDR